MLATYNEIDLIGEVQGECCEHDVDQTECDCFCHEAQQPDGDSFGEARIVRFPVPGGWEPDPEPTSPAACALCLEDGADADTGLCRICAARLPRAGGCGLAVWLVAGLTGGESGAALGHLTACADCRAFFDTLGELARAADTEADFGAHPAPAAVTLAA